MIRIWIVLAGFLLLTSYAFAQPNVLTNGDAVRIQSNVLQEERTLLVHTPDVYDVERGDYPVLMVLDGEWSFRTAVAITEHLAASGRMPAMIVVGVTNTMRDGRPARMADLAPAGPGDAHGGASLFRRFLLEEVLPYIDKTYQTSSHRILAGHSLGGLFTVSTMLEERSTFDAFIAISPSLGRNNQQQVQRARALLVDGSPFPRTLHLSMGNEGGNTMLGVQAFVDALEQQAPESLRWHMKHYEHEDHVSVVHHGMYDALEWIYKGWQVPEELLSDNDISIVQRHYASLSARLGVQVDVPEHYYIRLGYRILAEHEFDYARWTFEQYLNAYPMSAEPLVGLGDVALMAGLLNEAKKNYEHALQISPFHERAKQMVSALE